MKNVERKLTVNKFRFVSILQKRVAISRDPGNLFEDYQTKHLVYSTKTVIKSMEANLLRSKDIKADLKLKTRFSDEFSDGDRLIFLSADRLKLKHRDLVRISRSQDNTGRQEYSEIYGESGVYAGQAGSQPESENRIVYKTLILQADYDSFSDYVRNNFKTQRDFSLKSHIDLWISKRGENNFYAENKDPDNLKYPLVLSYNNFSSLKAKNLENNQEINFMRQVQDGVYIYVANFQVPANSVKLLQFSFEE